MKKFLCILLVVAFLAIPGIPASADVPFDTDGDFAYTIKNGEATIWLYVGRDPDMAFPDTIAGCPVTTILADVFSNCRIDINSVTIPDSVKRINGGAFSGCKELTTFLIGEGNPAYYVSGNCILEKGTNKLIAGCKASVIPRNVTAIGEKAFYGCAKLTGIEIPGSVRSIGEMAFYGCDALTRIEIPNGVETIGNYAFCYCEKLTSIRIPSSVKTVGEGALDTALTSITVDKGNPVYYASGNCLIEKGTEVLVAGCKTSVIPRGVKVIGRFAFSSCSSLTSIEIPDSVETIESYAFRSCTGLTSFVIPNSVKRIEDRAFSYCKGLTSIVIPGSVKTVGRSVFSDCSSLKDVYCEADAKPEGWDNGWLGSFVSKAVVHWGYRPPVAGDVMGNGGIDATDYLYLKRYCLGTYALSAVQKAAADVNGDGRINSFDYLLIKRHVLGTYKIG
ncbi:MAG: leucine-rich repeat protein [Oscillospiraceae bacterium]|nr:leucine-rich repeat protein [Oscillospiraceae bacterium]